MVVSKFIELLIGQKFYLASPNKSKCSYSGQCNRYQQLHTHVQQRVNILCSHRSVQMRLNNAFLYDSAYPGHEPIT